MSIPNRVDARGFQEFYPYPAARHKVHYWFAHRFLPKYVQQNPGRLFSYFFRQDTPGGAMEPTRFIQSRWAMFEEQAGLIPVQGNPADGGMVIRRVSELTMSIHVVADKPVALVQMPRPERPPEAYFVAAALLASPADPKSWPPDVSARVFTLESLHVEMYPELPDARERGVFCEWTKAGEHRNLGWHIKAEREALLEVVGRALLHPEALAAGGFTPPKDGAPGVISFSNGPSFPPRPQPVPETSEGQVEPKHTISLWRRLFGGRESRQSGMADGK